MARGPAPAKSHLQLVKVARQGSPTELPDKRIVEAVTVGGRGNDFLHIPFSPPNEVPIETEQRTVECVAGIGENLRTP